MNKLTAIALISLAVILAGCAASDPGAGFSEEIPQSEFDYFPPQASPEVENTFEINERFEVVWDRIINSASDSLNVESADKEAGLISLSYRVGDVTQHVDCGRSHHTFDFRDEFEEYKYPTAADITFKEMSYWEDGSGYKPAVLEVTRYNSLEGVVEVLVKPQGGVTNLKVEASYDIKVVMFGRFKKYSSMDGEDDDRSKYAGWNQQHIPSIDYPSFTTGESATETFYEGTVFEQTLTCVPKGTLEARIFEMAES